MSRPAIPQVLQRDGLAYRDIEMQSYNSPDYRVASQSQVERNAESHLKHLPALPLYAWPLSSQLDCPAVCSCPPSTK